MNELSEKGTKKELDRSLARMLFYADFCSCSRATIWSSISSVSPMTRDGLILPSRIWRARRAGSGGGIGAHALLHLMLASHNPLVTF